MTSTDNYSSQGRSRGCQCRGQARLRQADAVSAWKGFQVQNNDNFLVNMTRSLIINSFMLFLHLFSQIEQSPTTQRNKIVKFIEAG